MRRTYEYFCSGCDMLRSKNLPNISGDCPRCGAWYTRLIPVDWKDEWKTYWDLEVAHGVRFSTQSTKEVREK